MNLSEVEKKLRRLGFYNPKIGALQCGVSVTKMALQLQFGAPLDAGNTSRPKPGENRYDYGDEFVIAMVELECCQLSAALQAILAGTYVNPTSRNDNDKNKLICMRPNKILSFEKADNHGDATIKVSLYNMDVKKSRYFILGYKNGELTAFRGLVNACATLLPFVCLTIHGVIKAMKAAEYDDNNGDSTSSNYEQRPPRQQSTYSKPSTPPAQHSAILPVDSFAGGSDSPWDDTPAPSTAPPAASKKPPVDAPWDEDDSATTGNDAPLWGEEEPSSPPEDEEDSDTKFW